MIFYFKQRQAYACARTVQTSEYAERIMEKKSKHLGLRIDEDTHGKLKSLAEYDGRSMNNEVLYLIRQAVMEHEKEHGKLPGSRQE